MGLKPIHARKEHEKKKGKEERTRKRKERRERRRKRKEGGREGRRKRKKEKNKRKKGRKKKSNEGKKEERKEKREKKERKEGKKKATETEIPTGMLKQDNECQWRWDKVSTILFHGKIRMPNPTRFKTLLQTTQDMAGLPYLNLKTSSS